MSTKKQTEVPNWIGYMLILLIILQIVGFFAINYYVHKSFDELNNMIKELNGLEDIFTSASPTSNEGMELWLNSIPELDNKKDSQE